MVIILEKVVKDYGKRGNAFRALDLVSLEIASGSTVSIVGKSGSGKSTLMHVMSGLEKPSEGKIIVDGQDFSQMSAYQKDRFRSHKIGFIFQAFFIEARQSCYENVSLPLEVAGVPKRKRKVMIEQALSSVDLLSKQYELAGNLSGGQKQRLAIARAIVNKPMYIFADEPTGNLDSVNGENVIKLLFSLNESLKSTLVIVTHDHDLASRCDVQITLSDGIVIDTKTKAKKISRKKAKK